MERFNALGRGAQIMLVGSVLLLIDSFLRWQEISFLGASVGQNAWHGFWGVVMGLLTIVLIAWLVARLAAVNVPVPPSLTGAVLAFLIFAFALIKNLTDDYSTFWSWVGVGLGVVIAIGGWLQVQEAGGVENLRSEASSVAGAASAAAGSASGRAATGAGGAGAAAPEPPAPAPAAPAPPPAPTAEAAAESPAAEGAGAEPGDAAGEGPTSEPPAGSSA